jgi:hypothetical protein
MASIEEVGAQIQRANAPTKSIPQVAYTFPTLAHSQPLTSSFRQSAAKSMPTASASARQGINTVTKEVRGV